MTRRSLFSARIGGTGQETFSFNVGTVPAPTNIPRTTNPNTSATIYENTIPHAVLDPEFVGINVTKGDLGKYAYLVHVDFDVYQTTGSNKTYTLYLFRGSSGGPGGVAIPNHSAGKVTVATNQSGEWGASWIIPPPSPGLGIANNAMLVQLAADANHSVEFQGCKFRIERLGG
jgi:hypothetical protein